MKRLLLGLVLFVGACAGEDVPGVQQGDAGGGRQYAIHVRFDPGTFMGAVVQEISACHMTVSEVELRDHGLEVPASTNTFTVDCHTMNPTDPLDGGVYEFSSGMTSGKLIFTFKSFAGLDAPECLTGQGTTALVISQDGGPGAADLIVSRTGPGCTP